MPKELKDKKQLAIELYVGDLNLTQKAIAEEVGVSYQSILNWFNDPKIIDTIYKRYMEIRGMRLPMVVDAMIREAETGNVQAGRLVLEHFGKLDSRIKIQVQSPWEQFLQQSDVIEAEIVSDSDALEGVGGGDLKDEIVSIAAQAAIIAQNRVRDELPERDERNNKPIQRVFEEKERVAKVTQKELKRIKMRKHEREMYKLRRRAKAVGLEVQDKGRLTKSQRDEWLKELKRLERKKFGKIQK